jgi:hypothetical protein
VTPIRELWFSPWVTVTQKKFAFSPGRPSQSSFLKWGHSHGQHVFMAPTRNPWYLLYLSTLPHEHRKRGSEFTVLFTSTHCSISTKCSQGVTCHLRCSLELVFKIDPTMSPTWEMFILSDGFSRPSKTAHAAQPSQWGSRQL